MVSTLNVQRGTEFAQVLKSGMAVHKLWSYGKFVGKEALALSTLHPSHVHAASIASPGPSAALLWTAPFGMTRDSGLGQWGPQLRNDTPEFSTCHPELVRRKRTREGPYEALALSTKVNRDCRLCLSRVHASSFTSQDPSPALLRTAASG